MIKLSLNLLTGQISLGDERLTEIELTAIAEEVIRQAVYCFNIRSSHNDENFVIDNFLDLEIRLENIYLESIGVNLYRLLVAQANKNHWDKRIKLRIDNTYKEKLGFITLEMDLDATFDDYVKSEAPSSLGELVSDYPTEEEINAILRRYEHS